MRPCIALIAALSFIAAGPLNVHAQSGTVNSGLNWLVKEQQKDGSWHDRLGQSDVRCTSMAGLALLMEGSTAAKGKYAENIKLAIEWLTRQCHEGEDDGLMGPKNQQGRNGYTGAHAMALTFLASAYAREDKSDAKGLEARLARVRQREMEAVLKRAVRFSVRAQTGSGGWGLATGQDGQENTEATLPQIQALRAAELAGIDVPKETMKKAYAYLEGATTKGGGVVYTIRTGGERPGLTIAACAVNSGNDQISEDLLKKWLGYCRFAINPRGDEDAFHLAVALHGLGDEGCIKLMGKREDAWRWSKERDLLLKRFERVNGTMIYQGWNPSPVFGAATNLIVLQLENEHVPIYRMRKKW